MEKSAYEGSRGIAVIARVRTKIALHETKLTTIAAATPYTNDLSKLDVGMYDPYLDVDDNTLYIAA